MPQKKAKNSQRVKKRNIVFTVVLIVASIIILSVIGKFVARDIAERNRLEQQKMALDQTLKDVTILYQRFESSSNSPIGEDSPPENTCSQISSKGTAKQYTCGTRAKITFQKGDDKLFQSTNNLLKKSVTDVFNIEKDYGISEDGRNNAQRSQITIIHKTTGLHCDIFGGLYRDIESYTTLPNDIRFSFHCNLETEAPIFKIED